jgi:hypothetical protein
VDWWWVIGDLTINKNGLGGFSKAIFIDLAHNLKLSFLILDKWDCWLVRQQRKGKNVKDGGFFLYFGSVMYL